MARTVAASFLGLSESDSEDDLGAPRGKATTMISATKAPVSRNKPAAKSTTAATAASKVVKPAQRKTGASAAVRRAVDQRGAAALDEATLPTKPNSQRQRALADKTNQMVAEPANDVASAKPKSRPARKAAAPSATAAQEEEDLKLEEPPEVPKRRGRGRPKAKDATNENENPLARETTDMATGRHDDDDMVEEEEIAHREVAPFSEMMEVEPIESKNRSVTVDLPSPPVATSAAYARGSASTLSSSEDASARRRLGELTEKYDVLEAQYRDLKEVGIKEAERNFDRLKRQGENRAKISDDLIASLRVELAALRQQARDGAKAKREWEASNARAADLQTQLDELQKALAEAKAASKTLSTKLAAARTAAEIPSLPAGMAVPGSAIKTSAPTTASARAAVEAMQANSQMAQLKEDLYGDLTGLLVRSALRQGGREMYDCIQTGRNGSLHFKLCINEEDAADNNDADSAQFVYVPQLDARRDAALIEMLPDYLVEEISFSRMQAAKFYKRVTQALNEEL
ncbi:hypothetical protein SEPCBS119000_004171 [Sporothrix epigloea]|uniref:Monopolin complex subunit Csm1/Pcs1 C-terminal domain-containing protein n=1 Tax=Sporothrix epigloea TaxID=1892477 RepID=A0ABP0DQL3_9PEZI